ncbi:unnamed protein product [Absidia cylindrospora]
MAFFRRNHHRTLVCIHDPLLGLPVNLGIYLLQPIHSQNQIEMGGEYQRFNHGRITILAERYWHLHHSIHHRSLLGSSLHRKGVVQLVLRQLLGHSSRHIVRRSTTIDNHHHRLITNESLVDRQTRITASNIQFLQVVLLLLPTVAVHRECLPPTSPRGGRSLVILFLRSTLLLPGLGFINHQRGSILFARISPPQADRACPFKALACSKSGQSFMKWSVSSHAKHLDALEPFDLEPFDLAPFLEFLLAPLFSPRCASATSSSIGLAPRYLACFHTCLGTRVVLRASSKVKANSIARSVVSGLFTRTCSWMLRCNPRMNRSLASASDTSPMIIRNSWKSSMYCWAEPDCRRLASLPRALV